MEFSSVKISKTQTEFGLRRKLNCFWALERAVPSVRLCFTGLQIRRG